MAKGYILALLGNCFDDTYETLDDYVYENPEIDFLENSAQVMLLKLKVIDLINEADWS